MKIIQVSSFYPPHLGGGDNVVRAISEGLAKRNYNVEVITSNIGLKNNKLKPIKGLKINYLKSFEFAHASIIYSLFFKLMRVRKNSIIHLHVGHVFVPEMVFLVTKITKVPYLAHFHLETIPTGKFGFLLPYYKKFILSRVLQSAQKIIVPTEDYKKIVNKNYNIPFDKIVIIANGVNLKNFKPSLNKAKKVNKVLFVGRICKQKNVSMLIQAFKKVNQNFSNIELHIVGDGEDFLITKEQIKRENIQKKVILHGLLQEKKLFEMYRRADLLILPSSYESFGLVLIEAMASGLPVLSSDILAIRNVVKNNKTGLLVKPSVNNFTKALISLITDSKLRNQLAKNGLVDVHRYDWDVIVPQYENIYKYVLKGNY